MTNLKEIFNEWQHNIKFRDAFKTNPEQALREAGFKVSADDLAKIRAMLNLDKLQDDILKDRKTK